MMTLMSYSDLPRRREWNRPPCGLQRMYTAVLGCHTQHQKAEVERNIHTQG